MRKMRKLACLTLMALGVTVLPAAAEEAPELRVYTVDSTADAVDALPGDGHCRTAAQSCTLRAAVMETNALPLVPARIELPAGRFEFKIAPILFSGTLPLIPNGAAHGDLDLQAPVQITGAGARETIIDANGLDRIFAVGLLIDATIADMTITGGDAFHGILPINGGGGIWNHGHVTVRRVTIANNIADFGGGLFNTPTASAVVDSSTVSDNVARFEGGGIRFDAAGTVVNSTITRNRILPSCCPNPAQAIDGGNAGEGGGIDVRAVGPVTILNSTITENEAIIGGGGVNIAFGYQGAIGPVEGILGPLRLQNSIIANNRTTVSGPANCKQTIAPIISLGNNIADDGSCFLTESTDKPHVEPRLGAFANNGGPTDTYSLRGDSPAVDAAADCPEFDQRGVGRPQGPACDIGAIERRR